MLKINLFDYNVVLVGVGGRSRSRDRDRAGGDHRRRNSSSERGSSNERGGGGGSRRSGAGVNNNNTERGAARASSDTERQERTAGRSERPAERKRPNRWGDRSPPLPPPEPATADDVCAVINEAGERKEHSQDADELLPHKDRGDGLDKVAAVTDTATSDADADLEPPGCSSTTSPSSRPVAPSLDEAHHHHKEQVETETKNENVAIPKWSSPPCSSPTAATTSLNRDPAVTTVSSAVDAFDETEKPIVAPIAPSASPPCSWTTTTTRDNESDSNNKMEEEHLLLSSAATAVDDDNINNDS